eukprot:3075594-Amphidinium_carterae.1
MFIVVVAVAVAVVVVVVLVVVVSRVIASSAVRDRVGRTYQLSFLCTCFWLHLAHVPSIATQLLLVGCDERCLRLDGCENV